MLRLLLDPQIFNAQKFGGISRYHIEVYDILKSKDTIQIECPVLYTENKHFKDSRYFPHSYQQQNAFLINNSKILKPYRPIRLINRSQQHMIEQIKKQQFDVFIPTYYDPYFLDALKDKPFVLTVHDMIHELFPHYFPEDLATAQNKRILMEKAAKIIAVSENTKSDILKIYPHIPASKINVIYLASSLTQNPDLQLNLPQDYILFVGNRSLYKNFSFFVRSVAQILKATPALNLICAGGGPLSDEEIQLLKELNIESQVIQRNFEDAELSAYYKNALSFVFPSEYEGFGIPVLEAMSCGCPVVLTNHSSFPEVAGDAGVYFAPNDPSDLAEKIENLLNSAQLRQVYAQKGLAQTKKFSWSKTAEQTLRVYQQAAALNLIT